MQKASMIYGGEIIGIISSAGFQEFNHQRGLSGTASAGYHNSVTFPAYCASMDEQPILRVCSNVQVQIGFEGVEKIFNSFRSAQSRMVTIEHT
jgi:hypothetical protein